MHVIENIIEQWSDEEPQLNTDGLGIVLAVNSLHRQFLRQASDALKPFDLELFEYDVLSTLRRQGQPYRLAASAIARQSELSLGAMTNRINRLEARGLVKRGANPEDRRGVIVFLTADGIKVINSAISARVKAADCSLQGIGKRERSQLAGLLRKVRDHLDQDASDDSTPESR